MVGFAAAVVAVAGLCLAVEKTRVLGVALAALLLVLALNEFPLLFTTLFIVGGVAALLYVIHRHRRRHAYAIRCLCAPRD